MTAPDRSHPRAALLLFLVELRSGHLGNDELARMQRALRQAVTRRAADGAPIRWRSGVVVPADDRCLCWIEAENALDVTVAKDTAGLHGAAVRPVMPGDDPAPHPPTGTQSLTPTREELR